jgi:pimeloyl-ACP methyl ester carboxylesterase
MLEESVRQMITRFLWMSLALSACSLYSQGPQTDMTALPAASAAPLIVYSRDPLTPTSAPTQEIPTVIPGISTITAFPSTTPDVRVELVKFTTQDNIELAGTLFGEGELVVILAHMGMPGTDQRSWQPFARLLAERGYTALTFDFRGRGESAGKLEQSLLPYDMQAAIQLLTDRGYQRIVCIGASMGGTTCMRAALEHDLAGLGVIAGVLDLGKPNQISISEIQDLKLPKLLVYGAYEMPMVMKDMESLIELAPEPRLVQVYPTPEHGTALFDTQYGGQLTELLIRFLQAVRDGTPLGTG